MLDHLFTFFAFILGFTLMPGLLACFIGVRACRSLWLHILSTVHADVDFIQDTTVRTLVDTRRNQGIFTVLLRVEGEPRVEQVRRHLHEVVTRLDKYGEPRFPKLSMLLVSRWGSYAWKTQPTGKEFSVDQVLVVGGRSTHRGRPLTEMNVKEHVSEIVTRYLPRGAPPWQLVILPCAGSESHYLLLRMHHLLLTDGDVNIADLLPLAHTQEPILTDDTVHQYVTNSPLMNVLERPDHVISLYGALTENLTNRWNEFTSNHDPLNKPELLKNRQGLIGYFATVLVATVAIARRIWLGYVNVSPDLTSRWRYSQTCFKYELESRGISFSTFFGSIWTSIQPWNIIVTFVVFSYSLISLFLWILPLRVLSELQSILFRFVGHNPRSRIKTSTDMICDCAPMVFRAASQILRWTDAIYQAPRLFIDEMLVSRGWPGGTPVPLCGRKVVAWSKPVNGEKLRRISQKTGLSCTEVLLACLGGSLSDYYKESGTNAPDIIPVTARRISSGYLFSCGPNVRPQDAVSGMLCLRVPTVSDSTEYPECLAAVARSVAAARVHQPCVYAMSMLQTQHRIVTRAMPSVLVSVLFRYLSKKYTFAVTELMAGEEGGRTRYTTWGKKISDIIYWRPPQANISMSLCLNYYGDEVTLAVMSDALLSPHHVPLAEGLPQHVEALANAVGISP